MAELRRPPQAIRVLFVSPEIFPLAKTGGLADVSAALPVSIEAAGADVRLMMPSYPQALDAAIGKRVIAQFDDGLCWERSTQRYSALYRRMRPLAPAQWSEETPARGVSA